MLPAKELQQAVLHPVGVLVLVHQHPPEGPAVAVANVPEQLQQVHGSDQQVVEVHRVGLEHPPLVQLVDVRGGALEVRALGAGVLLGVDQLALGRRDLGANGARRKALRVDVQLPLAPLHHAQGVGLVVDRERALVAEPLGVRPQDPRAGRVERHHPHEPRHATDQPLDPLAHLPRRLVGEGDREDLSRLSLPGGQQVGDPIREHAGLSGPGAGEHEQGSLAVGDRLALGRIQLREQALDLAHARLQRPQLSLGGHRASIAAGAATAAALSRRPWTARALGSGGEPRLRPTGRRARRSVAPARRFAPTGP